jgi:hypothetical protein
MGTYMEATYTVPMTLRTLALHRVLDGNLWLQRLGAQVHQLARPVASPTQAAAITVTDGATPMPHDQSM